MGLTDVTFTVDSLVATISDAGGTLGSPVLPVAGDGNNGGTFDLGGSILTVNQGQVAVTVFGFPVLTQDFAAEPLSPEMSPGNDGIIVVTDLGNGFHQVRFTGDLALTEAVLDDPPTTLDLAGNLIATGQVPSSDIPEPSGLLLAISAVLSGIAFLRLRRKRQT